VSNVRENLRGAFHFGTLGLTILRGACWAGSLLGTYLHMSSNSADPEKVSSDLEAGSAELCRGYFSFLLMNYYLNISSA
jgi:hypothetical protein